MFKAYKAWAGAVSAAALALGSFPSTAGANSPSLLRAGLERSADQGMVGFYRTRAHDALWTRGGTVDPAAGTLIDILNDAELDGMAEGPVLAKKVRQAIARAQSGRPGDLAEAELLLSRAWVKYVQTLRRPVDVGMTYAPGAVSPLAPFTAEILKEAATAPSLDAHLREAAQLNPVYSQLRKGLAAWRARGQAVLASSGDDGAVEKRLRLNLDRARALPTPKDGRFILVDAAAARMYLYEDGQVRDSMRVIVGKPDERTPMIAGVIRHAVLNPYWNVPPDLVRKRIAAGVLAEGVGYLAAKRYEVLADWSDNPRRLDPKRVDWAAVAAGTNEVRVRQLPGVGNAMGEVKYMFPNDFGVYLHDTPDKTLFAQADRRLSSGCVRLEDAKRVGRWLFGKMPRAASRDPEQEVALARSMPVYIGYFTAAWDGERLALNDDRDDRDMHTAQFAGTLR